MRAESSPAARRAAFIAVAVIISAFSEAVRHRLALLLGAPPLGPHTRHDGRLP
ncbi:hypothetical protein [Streptomyces sp. NPDC059861]|uniref:hypothetical protein n=1 Tax=Streptomyces sp. NPDC059861 TaxID=3346974 RepID=UPI003648A6D5